MHPNSLALSFYGLEGESQGSVFIQKGNSVTAIYKSHCGQFVLSYLLRFNKASAGKKVLRKGFERKTSRQIFICHSFCNAQEICFVKALSAL